MPLPSIFAGVGGGSLKVIFPAKGRGRRRRRSPGRRRENLIDPRPLQGDFFEFSPPPRCAGPIFLHSSPKRRGEDSIIMPWWVQGGRRRRSRDGPFGDSYVFRSPAVYPASLRSAEIFFSTSFRQCMGKGANPGRNRESFPLDSVPNSTTTLCGLFLKSIFSIINPCAF